MMITATPPPITPEHYPRTFTALGRMHPLMAEDFLDALAAVATGRTRKEMADHLALSVLNRDRKRDDLVNVRHTVFACHAVLEDLGWFE
jgi:hypothetical protein